MKKIKPVPSRKRIKDLERKVEEIDQSIVRLILLLDKTKQSSGKSNLKTSFDSKGKMLAVTQQNIRRLRGGSAPTSAQSASIAHLRVEGNRQPWT